MLGSTMTIRKAQHADLPAINEIYNHYVTQTCITFDYASWTLERRQRWLDKLQRSNGYYHVLVKESESGEIVGFAYNSEFREKQAFNVSSEITIYLHPERRAKGLGSELMAVLLEEIASSPICRAYSLITLPNTASMKLHEKFGFKQVGILTDVGYKFGQFHSVAMLEKITL